MGDYRILSAGDAAVVVEFGDLIARAVNGRVLSLARALDGAAIDGVVETAPTFRSLMICYEPAKLGRADLVARIEALMTDERDLALAARTWRFPVCYDPSLAPDLCEIAERKGLSPAEIAARHSAITHHVYMLGFLPGQPYLGDLPAELATQRRATPRARVAAGSVGIAMTMTCIFPKETPCGLNIIGRTPAPLFGPERAREAWIEPGDKVVFEPISLSEFEALAAHGDWRLTPETGGEGWPI